MRSLLNFIWVVGLIALLLTGCAKETNQTPEELKANAVELLQKGKTHKALKEAKKALEKAEGLFGRENLVLVDYLETIAFVYQAQKEYYEAESFHCRALEIVEKVEGPDSFEAAKLKNNLAGLYFYQYQFDKALTAYKEAMEIGKKHYSPDDPQLQNIQTNIEMIENLKTGKEPSPVIAQTSVSSDTPDLVPEKIKKEVLDKLVGQNIVLYDLKPEPLIKIGAQGVVLPYRCKKRVDKDAEGLDVVLLFAAIKKDKENTYSFKNCRISSYQSYQSELMSGNIGEALMKIFPEVFL